MGSIKLETIRWVIGVLLALALPFIGFAFKFSNDHVVIGGRMTSLEQVTKEKLDIMNWKIDQLYNWELESRRGLK